MTTRTRVCSLLACVCSTGCTIRAAAQASELPKIEANRVAQISLASEKVYRNPFLEVQLDAMVTQPDGSQLRVPAFWAGGNQWCFRYASRTPGWATWRTECSDPANSKLHRTQETNLQ